MYEKGHPSWMCRACSDFQHGNKGHPKRRGTKWQWMPHTHTHAHTRTHTKKHVEGKRPQVSPQSGLHMKSVWNPAPLLLQKLSVQLVQNFRPHLLAEIREIPGNRRRLRHGQHTPSPAQKSATTATQCPEQHVKRLIFSQASLPTILRYFHEQLQIVRDPNW